MTRKLQILRGTTAQNNAYTGAVGELTMDTDRNEVRIHDGSTVGGIKISDRNMPILTSMFFDHITNDMSWLRADTFSWQSGAVYQAAYAHLTADITGKTLQSETISGTTIQFYLADDGHKICPASEESNVTAIYNATGVAWYYILDTVNEQFKLPRTKHGFTGLRDSVGGYVKPGAPNITGSVGEYWTQAASGAFYSDSGNKGSETNSSHGANNLSFDASRSSSVYGASDTIQPPATQMYLYFYVGYFGQTAIEQTAGVTTETLNRKVDIDLGNLPTNIDYVVESQEPTSSNSYTWYRKYKSGWVEQGGRVTISNTISASNVRVTFPVEMANGNYTAICANNANVGIAGYVGWESTTAMSVGTMTSKSGTTTWFVAGLAKQ